MGGCMQNDGNIGRWFGMWKVECIEHNDVALSDYHGNVVLKFQSGVMESCSVYDHHVLGRWVASCRYEPDALIVSAGNDPTGSAGFAPEMKLPWVDNIRLQIIAAEDDRTTLRYEGDEQNVYVYYLKKIYD